MSTSTLQQFFGRHDANWNLYATKEQRQTKVTIGFLSLILMIGATMWIAQGAFIQYSSIFSSPACSEVRAQAPESRTTRYCAGQWRVYIQGWRSSRIPEREGLKFAWHKVHASITLGMGLMFVTINYLWWMWEKGLVSKYTAGFADKAMHQQCGQQTPGCTNRQHQLCCSLPYHKQALGLVLCQIPYHYIPHWCSHYWTICFCTSDVGNCTI